MSENDIENLERQMGALLHHYNMTGLIVIAFHDKPDGDVGAVTLNYHNANIDDQQALVLGNIAFNAALEGLRDYAKSEEATTRESFIVVSPRKPGI